MTGEMCLTLSSKSNHEPQGAAFKERGCIIMKHFQLPAGPTGPTAWCQAGRVEVKAQLTQGADKGAPVSASQSLPVCSRC